MFSTLTEDEVIKLAEKVGRKVHRQYPSVEREEITSEALVVLTEVAHKLETPTAGHVFRVLERAAFKYAAQERYRVMLASSQYIYTPSEVRQLLKKYWNPDSWDVPTSEDDYLYAEVEHNVIGVSLMDLRGALGAVKPNHRKNLERKFRDGVDVNNKLIRDSLDALTRSLNRSLVQRTKTHEGPGARKAISNARAQVITEDIGGRPERDALDKAQSVYKQSPCKPAGTFFDWNRYKEGNGRD